MAKSKYQKKGRKKYVAKRRAVKKSGISSLFYNYMDNSTMSRKLHMPMPDGFRTTLYFEWESVEGVGAPASTNYNVKASMARLPLNVTAYVIGATALNAPPGTGVSQSLTTATKNCTGLSKFFIQTTNNRFYNQLHVLNSHIKVTYTPLALADSLDLCIVPQSEQESTIYATVGDAAQSPHAKSRVITTSVPNMSVSNSVNCASYFGVTEQDYVSNPAYGQSISGTGVFIDPARSSTEGGQLFWTIIRTELNNQPVGASTGLPYKIQCSYDCVFHNLANFDLTEN